MSFGRAREYIISHALDDPEMEGDEITGLREEWACIAHRVGSGEENVLDGFCARVDSCKSDKVQSLAMNTRKALKLAGFVKSHYEETGKIPQAKDCVRKGGFKNRTDVFVTASHVSIVNSLRKVMEVAGLPVIGDLDDIENAKMLLEKDLWKTYNRKNGFEEDNRHYRPGTDLPSVFNCYYDGGNYREIYGDFETALEMVILSERQPVPEVMNEEVLNRIFELSLRLGRIPGPDEISVCDYESVIESIREVLERDLMDVVDRFTGRHEPVLRINRVLLNKYTKYFRSFGPRLYKIWFSDIMEFFEKKTLAVKKFFRSVFREKEGHRFDYLDEMVDVDDGMVEGAESSSDMELKTMVENFFGLVFGGRNDGRFNPDSARAILRFWNEFDIPVKPRSVWFTYSADSLDRVFERFRHLMDVFEEYDDFPFNVKAQIMHGNMTADDLRRRIRLFEDAGITSDYYLPYLVDDSDGEIVDQSIPMIRFTIEREKRLEELSRKRIESRGRKETREQRNKIRSAEFSERDEAVAYLKEAGVFYSPRAHAPELMAAKVRVMRDMGVPVRTSWLGMPIEHVRRRCEAYIEMIEQNNREFVLYLEERGLVLPNWVFALGVPKRTLLEKMEYIESCGVPMRNACWSWLNLGQEAMDRAIYKKWKSLTMESRSEALYDYFGIDDVPDGVKRREPDGVWEYLRLMKSLGLTGSDVPLSWINQFSFGDFRDKIYKMLKEGGGRKNKVQITVQESYARERFVNIYELAEKVRLVLGYADAHDVFDFISDFRMKTVDRCFKSGSDVSNVKSGIDVIYERLRERARNHNGIRERLLRLRASYADMDYFMNNCSLAALKERLEVFEKANEPVSMELLREDPSIIACALERKFMEPADVDEYRGCKTYLLEAGVNPLLAEKLARLPVSVDDYRAKVEFFGSYKLDEDEYGCAVMPVFYYEKYLDKPMSYCTSGAVRNIMRKMLEDNARRFLADNLRIDWDYDPSDLIRRSTALTLVQKYQSIAEYEAVQRGEIVVRALILRAHSDKRMSDILDVFLDEFKSGLSETGFPGGRIEELAGFALIEIREVCEMFDRIGVPTDRYIDTLLKFLKTKDYSLVFSEEIGLAKEILRTYEKVVREEGGHRTLSREQERALFLAYGQTKDINVRNAIIMSNLRVVYFWARKYLGRGVDELDLIQHGNLLLMCAIENFDVDAGEARFSTYASVSIKYGLYTYVLEHGRVGVRVPAYVHAQIRKVNAVRMKLIDEGCSEEKLRDELEKRFGAVALNRLLKVSGWKEVGFDDPVFEDFGDRKRGDEASMKVYEEGERELAFGSFDLHYLRKATVDILGDVVSERDLNVFFDIFGLNSEREEIPEVDLAKKWNVTRQRIAQIKKKIIRLIGGDNELREIYADYLF